MWNLFGGHLCLPTFFFLAFLMTEKSAFGTTDVVNMLNDAEAARKAYMDTYRLHGASAVNPQNLRTAANMAYQAYTKAAERGDDALTQKAALELGNLLRMDQNFDLAVQALNEATRGYDEDLAIEAWLQLARVQMYRPQPDLGEARRSLTEAQIRLGDTPSPKQRFDLLSFSSELDVYSGNYEAAVALVTSAFTDAKKASESGLMIFARLGQADALVKMAERCDYVDTFDECRQAAEAAARAYEAAKAEAEEYGWFGLIQQIDQLRSGLGMRDQMIDLKEQGLAQYGGVFTPKSIADVLVTETFVPPADGTGHPLAQIAGEVVDDTETARNAYLLGKRAEILGNMVTARAQFHRGTSLLELERGSIFDPYRTGSVIENRVEIYRDTVLHDLEAGDFAGAFQMLERLRARGLAELLTQPDDVERPRALSELIMAEAGVSLANVGIVNLVLDEEAVGKIEEASMRLNTSRRKREEVAKTYAGHDQETGPNWEPPTLDRLEEQARQHNFTVLQYLVTETNLIAWAIGPKGSAVRSVFVPRSALEAKVNAIRASTATESGAKPTQTFPRDIAKELYLYLIAPMSRWIAGDRLVIVPHGELGGLPFETLINPESDESLLSERILAYAPNVTFIVDRRRAELLPLQTMSIIQNRSADLTASQIAPVVEPHLDLSVIDGLTREALEQQVGEADILHIGAHGRHRAVEPLLSWVKIPESATSRGDWTLRAAELISLPLGNTQLAVFAACESARTERTIASEMFGIPWAAMVAGVQNLVVSRWQVNDQETARWMAVFYDHVMKGHDVAAAAREASLTLADSEATGHPYYWAAFQAFAQ